MELHLVPRTEAARGTSWPTLSFSSPFTTEEVASCKAESLNPSLGVAAPGGDGGGAPLTMSDSLLFLGLPVRLDRVCSSR